MQPVISVVIPTYNRLPFLQEAIASVQAQTYTNWQLIVVDDESTDETKAMVEAIADERILILSLPHCGNIAVLRNAGAAAGSGEWISFLDSDDVWLPEKLALQLAAIQQHHKSWVYGRSELMNTKGETIDWCGKYNALSGWITVGLLNDETSISIGSLLIKRELFEELEGFDPQPELILREDQEFALRLSLKAEGIALPQLLVRVREHKGRSTRAVDDGYERTAYLYGHFAANCSDKKLKQLALQRQAYHITEMAAKKIREKKYWKALRLLGQAFRKGDKLGHQFSVFYRNISVKQAAMI